jgi:hypothetical protein
MSDSSHPSEVTLTATVASRLQPLPFWTDPNDGPDFQDAILTDSQWGSLLIWVTDFENPPAEGTYRVLVEPRERLWSPIIPTAETAFFVAMGMRDAPRGVFRGTMLGRLICT